MKKIAILGSTGSIGTQTLDVVRANDDLEVVGLAAGSNVEMLEKQIREFHPRLVAVWKEEAARDLAVRVQDLDVKIVSQMGGLIELARMEESDILVTAIVGMIGIRPTMEAILAGKDIALANKETLVTAGHLIMPLAKQFGVQILPVDSEHSAIFQALHGEKREQIHKLLITASGGPFRGKKTADLEKVTLEDTLKHPNWAMGQKITIDSATLVNKGLEVMEAKWLFDVDLDHIQVVVQPKSIIHSMVEFVDGAVMAQLGTPDMKLPIQYALFYPDRVLACGVNYIKAAKEENVLVAIKHFPGDGCDEVDQHILTSVNSLSCEEWDATYGKIYSGLIQAGAQTVMVGHIAQPAYQKAYNPDFPDKLVPATLSPELLKGLLRKKLGFNGLIVTDSTCMVGFSCAMEREKAVPYAIEAGCDMFLFNKDLDEDYRYMLNGYRQGILSEQRLDEAITRILATKAALGLYKKAKSEIVPTEEALRVMRSDEHVTWAKESANAAVTLVKDTQKILPLSPRKTKKVLLEIMGDFPSNERVLESFRSKLVKEGFDVTIYEPENFETAKFDVGTFKKSYDLVIYIGNVENASNKVTNRLSWYTFWGNGNNVPWFVAERPVMFISLANPYHLIDVPMIKTYINGYSNSEYVIESVVEKIMGRSAFTGKNPVDPFCGKEYLKW